MAGKTILDKVSIYIPQDKLKQRLVERLMKLGEKHDRSTTWSSRRFSSTLRAKRRSEKASCVDLPG